MADKVLMAMSGGIDSSVAAILLLEQGYELVGVTFRNHDFITTDSTDDEHFNADPLFDAEILAKKLGFENHIIDVREMFKNTVINNFVDEYLHCRTPNPCVFCNLCIKWGFLLTVADKLGCKFIATGHYAQLALENDRYFLKKGVDAAKDQTYFLWALTQENLSRTIFPLGKLTKAEVRNIAAAHGYERLLKKGESQEICFVPDNDYRKFLEDNVQNIKELHVAGNFVDTFGKVLGQHRGLYNYTIGQRKGLGIALGQPAYVVALNLADNTVVLGNKDELSGQRLHAGKVNMMKYSHVTDGMEVMAKIRYRNHGGKAKLYVEDYGLRVEFEQPVDSITPGQSVVFYEDDDLVGGGVIM